MALPELDIARTQRWCAVPEHARHQVRVECLVAPRQLIADQGPALGMCRSQTRSKVSSMGLLNQIWLW